MSTTATPWSRTALIELLRRARVKNEALGVTGVLLHRRTGFVQLLEGPRPVLEDLYATIHDDPRHDNVSVIWDDTSDTRWFTGWWMAFRDLEDDPVVERGLTDVLRGPYEASRFSHDVVLQLWTLLRPHPDPAPPG